MSTMDKAKTHLGTQELRNHHSVMVEGGKIPRARIMDQRIIDRYLMEGLLSLKQHHAGEYLLGQAARAGLWPTGVNLSGDNVEGGRRDYIPFGMFPYGRTLVAVKKRYGPYHAYVVQRVVCHDWNVTGQEYNMTCLREGLNHIADRRMGWRENPLRHIERAAEERAANQ